MVVCSVVAKQARLGVLYFVLSLFVCMHHVFVLCVVLCFMCVLFASCLLVSVVQCLIMIRSYLTRDLSKNIDFF